MEKTRDDLPMPVQATDLSLQHGSDSGELLHNDNTSNENTNHGSELAPPGQKIHASSDESSRQSSLMISIFDNEPPNFVSSRRNKRRRAATDGAHIRNKVLKHRDNGAQSDINEENSDINSNLDVEDNNDNNDGALPSILKQRSGHHLYTFEEYKDNTSKHVSQQSIHEIEIDFGITKAETERVGIRDKIISPKEEDEFVPPGALRKRGGSSSTVDSQMTDESDRSLKPLSLSAVNSAPIANSPRGGSGRDTGKFKTKPRLIAHDTQDSAGGASVYSDISSVDDNYNADTGYNTPNRLSSPYASKWDLTSVISDFEEADKYLEMAKDGEKTPDGTGNKSKQKKIRVTCNNCYKWRQRCNKLEISLESIKKRTENLSHAINHTQDNSLNVQRNYDELKQEYDRLSNKCNDLTQELNQVKENAGDKLLNTKQNLENEMKLLNKNYQNTLKLKNEIESKYDQLLQTNKKLTLDYTQLEDKISQLQSTNERLSKDNNEKDEAFALKQQEMRKECSELQTQFDAVKQDFQTYFHDGEKTRKELNGKIDELESQNSLVQSELSDLKNEKQMLEESMAKLKETNAKLMSQIEESKEKLHNETIMKDEIDRLKEKLTISNDKSEQLHKQILQKENAFEQVVNSIADLEKRIEIPNSNNINQPAAKVPRIEVTDTSKNDVNSDSKEDNSEKPETNKNDKTKKSQTEMKEESNEMNDIIQLKASLQRSISAFETAQNSMSRSSSLVDDSEDVAKLKEKCNKYQDLSAKQQSEIRSLKQHISERGNEMTQLHSEIEKLNNKVHELTLSANKKQNDLVNSRIEKASLQERIAQLNTVNDKKREQIDKLIGNLEKKTVKIENLEQSKMSFENHKNKIGKELVETKELLVKSENELKSLNAWKTDTTNDLERFKTKIAKLNKENEKLMDENSELKDQLSDATTNVHKIKTKLGKSKDRKKNDREEIEVLQTKLDSCIKERNALEKKNTRLKTRVNNLRSENKSLQESINLLESTVDDAQALMTAKERRLKNLSSKANKLELQSRKHNRHLTSMRNLELDAVQKKHSKLMSVKQSKAQLVKENADLMKENEDLTKNLKETQTKNKDLHAKFKLQASKLKSQISKHIAENNSILAEKLAIEDECDAMRDTNNNLTNTLNDLDKKYRILDAKYREYKQLHRLNLQSFAGTTDNLSVSTRGNGDDDMDDDKHDDIGNTNNDNNELITTMERLINIERFFETVELENDEFYVMIEKCRNFYLNTRRLSDKLIMQLIEGSNRSVNILHRLKIKYFTLLSQLSKIHEKYENMEKVRKNELSRRINNLSLESLSEHPLMQMSGGISSGNQKLSLSRRSSRATSVATTPQLSYVVTQTGGGKSRNIPAKYNGGMLYIRDKERNIANNIILAYFELQQEMNGCHEIGLRELNVLLDEYRKPLDMSIYAINDESEQESIKWQQLCQEFEINWDIMTSDPTNVESQYTQELKDTQTEFKKVLYMSLFFLHVFSGG